MPLTIAASTRWPRPVSYGIIRKEFDDFLLRRAEAAVHLMVDRAGSRQLGGEHQHGVVGAHVAVDGEVVDALVAQGADHLVAVGLVEELLHGWHARAEARTERAEVGHDLAIEQPVHVVQELDLLDVQLVGDLGDELVRERAAPDELATPQGDTLARLPGHRDREVGQRDDLRR